MSSAFERKLCIRVGVIIHHAKPRAIKTNEYGGLRGNDRWSTNMKVGKFPSVTLWNPTNSHAQRQFHKTHCLMFALRNENFVTGIFSRRSKLRESEAPRVSTPMPAGTTVFFSAAHTVWMLFGCLSLMHKLIDQQNHSAACSIVKRFLE